MPLTFKNQPISLSGPLLIQGQVAPEFSLVDVDLQEHLLKNISGYKVLSTAPSLDTPVCSQMSQQLNELASQFPQVQFLMISADLPFAQKKFCQSQKIANLRTLSTLGHPEFGKNYGVEIISPPLKGLLARCVWLLDEKNQVLYTECVSEITQEPNYAKLAQALSEHMK